MQIHISRGGQQSGPYSTEDINAYLANGTLLPTDLAYQEGMTEWVPVSQISGVVMGDNRTVTSSPPSTPVQNGNKKKILIGVGATLGLLAVAAAIFFVVITKGNPPKPTIDKKAVSIAQAKLTEWEGKAAELRKLEKEVLVVQNRFRTEKDMHAQTRGAIKIRLSELLSQKEGAEGTIKQIAELRKELAQVIDRLKQITAEESEEIDKLSSKLAAKKSELPDIQKGIVAASTDLKKINTEHNQAIEEWYLSLVRCLHCENKLAQKLALRV